MTGQAASIASVKKIDSILQYFFRVLLAYHCRVQYNSTEVAANPGTYGSENETVHIS